MTKLWGGRFTQETDELVQTFNASISFDVRLYQEDIDGSVAWAKALGEAGVLSKQEVTAISDGLEEVRQELESGAFEISSGDEDIHTAVERRLTELVGEVGGKLHTGRSRNDQVATDFRLWCMRATDQLMDGVRDLQAALVQSAEENSAVLLPGY
ncbi:MAG TPA: lyase family protein, partial [Candidatus Binatia bacterium]|nr:lyase family protein [Candidatus Binatia bacterium]